MSDQPPIDDDLLAEAANIVNDRENRHGSIYETHKVFADLVSVYLSARTGHEIELAASEGADILDLLKDARKATGERGRDTFRDGIGYNYCAWKCIEIEQREAEE